MRFVKFPSTPYLWRPEGVDVRADKVMSGTERKEFLSHPLRAEEKVDGQNLGITADGDALRFQTRGSFVEPGGRQFRGLATWVAPRSYRIARAIGSDLILFGEWCADAHSVTYESLPDWFLLFDVYQRSTSTFWCSMLRNELAADLGMVVTPLLEAGHFDEADILQMLGPSRLGSQPMEGVVLRLEQPEKVVARAKVVRPDFVQTIEKHWTEGERKPNRLATAGSR